MNDSLNNIVQDHALKEQFKKLVLQRVGAMPDSLRMAVGSMALTRADAIVHVQNEDEIGKQIMAMELDFLRDMASGVIYAGVGE
jgi:hypothetical protein